MEAGCLDMMNAWCIYAETSCNSTNVQNKYEWIIKDKQNKTEYQIDRCHTAWSGKTGVCS